MSNQTQPLTAKNFNKRLNTFLDGEVTRRDKLQSMIVFAIMHYAGTTGNDKQTKGDTSLMSALIKGCIGVKNLPTITLKDYIKAHANVKYVKSSDGSHVFQKDGKGVDVSVKECVVPWYEWEGAKHNNVKPDFDMVGQALALLKRLTTAESEGRPIKDAEKAAEIKTALAGVLTTS